ncbi:MAG: HEAT repeat domain-containing protein [Planctomycetota bacterium]|jgi:HEAT repeat protein
MSTNKLRKASLAAGAVAAATATARGAGSRNRGVNRLLKKIRSADAETRTDAWQSAGDVGTPAVQPLALVMTDDDLEVARAAKRAMWQIVRYTGRPGATNARTAVVAKLCGLLGADQPVSVRREVVWMLSEIGAQRAIRPLAELLSNEHLREDARCALERIPIPRAVQALKAGFEVAPEDFKPNLAQSLRKRGVKVSGYPCVKLVPAK